MISSQEFYFPLFHKEKWDFTEKKLFAKDNRNNEVIEAYFQFTGSF